MATLEAFLRSGQLGPVVLGMAPTAVTDVIGEPRGISKKSNPLQLKYGALQLSFWPSPMATHQLREIAILYQPIFESLPDPVRFTDWEPLEAPTQMQFVQFIESKNLTPIDTSQTPDGVRFSFVSGVVAFCAEEILHSLRLQQRQNKEVDAVQLSGHLESSLEQIVEMLKEADRAVQSGAHRAALLVAWAGLEATLRHVAVHSGFAGKLRVQPSILIRELFAAGRLTRDQRGELERLRQVRTRVAHGLPDGPSDLETQIVAIRRLTTHLLSSSTTRKVMIRCPNTGKPVFTGIATDPQSWMNPMNQLMNNYVQCPHCGLVHTWSKEDAFLAE